jgi:hypothetical protein
MMNFRNIYKMKEHEALEFELNSEVLLIYSSFRA